MNCEEFHQNAPSYALGALSANEQAAFEQHIAECDVEHEVAAFSEIASRLSEAAPLMEPPAGLRDRILAAAEADVATGNLRRPDPVDAVLRSGASAPTGLIHQFRSLSAPAYAAAAILLIVAGALIGWAVASQTFDDSSVDLRLFHREGDGDWLRIEAELGKSDVTLSVGNLDQLPGQNRYEFWAIRDERWVPIGEFNTNPEGRWSGQFDFALQQGDAIAITVEPEGGSQEPTSEAEIRSRI